MSASAGKRGGVGGGGGGGGGGEVLQLYSVLCDDADRVAYSPLKYSQPHPTPCSVFSDTMCTMRPHASE